MGSCLSGDGSSGVPYTAASSCSSSSAFLKKKMKGRESSSFDSNMEMWLHRIPGRLFLNGSTDNASLFSKQGRKGINQDAMILWENFGSKGDTVFCGVFDGHGPNGHLVAKKVRDALPLKLGALWQLNGFCKDAASNTSSSSLNNVKSEGNLFSYLDVPRASSHNEHNGDQTALFLKLKDSFLKAYKVMDKELKVHPRLDSFCSGTTAVTLFKQGNDLVIGNIGDSRAVLSTKDENNSLVALQLTTDHKPSLLREAERIRLCKGRVLALPSEPQTARVWLPNSDFPGLAMARAFGDFCLKDYGLISVPEITYRRLTDKDEFVVLATDGVWDVLSNKEVIDIVASATRSSAARTLVESAVRAWRSKYRTSKVDDCAAVCLFLSSNSDSSSSSFSTAG